MKSIQLFYYTHTLTLHDKQTYGSPDATSKLMVYPITYELLEHQEHYKSSFNPTLDFFQELWLLTTETQHYFRVELFGCDRFSL